MPYNKYTTFGEILRLNAKVRKEYDVFKIGKSGLARAFLRELLDLDAHANDEELESAYKASSSNKKIPADSEGFWRFVETEYLQLEAEPNTKFLELSFKVNQDLIALADNLMFIRKELKLLDEKKRNDGRLTANERYYRNQLEYFEKKNLIAKDEIVDFMTHKIKRHAIESSMKKLAVFSLVETLLGNSPYPFGRRLIWASVASDDPYDVRSLNEYSNKFLDLPISSYRKIVKECKSSSDKFKEYATAYINGFSGELRTVREKLADLIKKSHILADRKNVIETMLRHFEEKDYISFVSMAPLQIEGIFADICRGIGVSESELDISSLNHKLLNIDEKMGSFFYFEYYSFKFPVLRNLVAHGGLVDGDLEDTALHLMLDLLPVCELSVSEDLPIMHAIKVLNEASNGNNSKLVEWLDLRRLVTIPDFYAVQETITKADGRYAAREFWDYLEGELKKLMDIDQVKTSVPNKVAGKLKSMGIAAEQADKFLKSSGRVAAEAIKERSQRLEKFTNLLKPSEAISKEDV